MNPIFYLANFGGILSILIFIHFFVDWIFQSHATAMAKHNRAVIRATHCLIYTCGFIPLLAFSMFYAELQPFEFAACLLILFFSHFIEDTYFPVFLWAKYIRRAPQFRDVVKPPVFRAKQLLNMKVQKQFWYQEEDEAIYMPITYPSDKAAFAAFIATPLGTVLMIAIDQIIHITFLLPIAWMIMRHI
jgi:hypothetical protein